MNVVRDYNPNPKQIVTTGAPKAHLLFRILIYEMVIYIIMDMDRLTKIYLILPMM